MYRTKNWFQSDAFVSVFSLIFLLFICQSSGTSIKWMALAHIRCPINENDRAHKTAEIVVGAKLIAKMN